MEYSQQSTCPLSSRYDHSPVNLLQDCSCTVLQFPYLLDTTVARASSSLDVALRMTATTQRTPGRTVVLLHHLHDAAVSATLEVKPCSSHNGAAPCSLPLLHNQAVSRAPPPILNRGGQMRHVRARRRPDRARTRAEASRSGKDAHSSTQIQACGGAPRPCPPSLCLNRRGWRKRVRRRGDGEWSSSPGGAVWMRGWGSGGVHGEECGGWVGYRWKKSWGVAECGVSWRSEEHTSEHHSR